MKPFLKEQDNNFCGQNDRKPHLIVLQLLTTNVCIIRTALTVEETDLALLPDSWKYLTVRCDA